MAAVFITYSVHVCLCLPMLPVLYVPILATVKNKYMYIYMTTKFVTFIKVRNTENNL
jgi:hypothetical protein